MNDPFFGIEPQFPNQEQLKCPRCESTNTKFCYYNNYNLSQPRHFCKNCKRYWTKGGSLRNIPVGGGTRKNAKRPSNQKRQISGQDRDLGKIHGSTSCETENSGQDSGSTSDVSLSFGSLLTSDGQFGSDLEGMNRNGSGLIIGEFVEDLNSSPGLRLDSGRHPGLESGSSNNTTKGWTDLAIYTPASTFQ